MKRGGGKIEKWEMGYRLAQIHSGSKKAKRKSEKWCIECFGKFVELSIDKNALGKIETEILLKAVSFFQ